MERKTMKQITQLLATFGVFVFALSACNLPVKAPSSSDPLSAASTIVAMTLKAQGPLPSPVTNATPFASPVVATANVTATTKPTLTINNNTSCRGGPSQDDKVIASLAKGITVDMIAKDTADGYWLVKDPTSADICWVEAKDATPGGSFDSLPEVTPQPTANTSVPNRPGSLFFNYSCDTTSTTTTLTWSDNADNETGYHVYRLGNLVADLPPNSTSYTDIANVPPGTQLTYSVEAYNASGASPQRAATFTCQ
jgi:hypothetical protein